VILTTSHAAAGSILERTHPVVGANPVTTSDLPSIREISLAYGDVVRGDYLTFSRPLILYGPQIDGFSVTYTQGSGETRTTFSHGTSLNATDSGLRKSTLTLTGMHHMQTVAKISIYDPAS
jgi:hypothetical protein